jgi:hypothetical protein
MLTPILFAISLRKMKRKTTSMIDCQADKNTSGLLVKIQAMEPTEV